MFVTAKLDNELSDLNEVIQASNHAPDLPSAKSQSGH